MLGPSTDDNGCVVAAIAETALHKLYSSLPLKSARVHTCAPINVSDQIEQLQPAVILLDCGLEVEKGLRMLTELKQSFPHVPVIFLTDSKSYDTVVKVYRAGARDFVGKPANLFELRNTIESIVEIKRACKEARSPFIVARGGSGMGLAQRSSLGKIEPVLRVIRYIEDNLSNRITLDLLAKEAGLSKYHFSRVFYRHTKMTPVQFAARMRVEKAKGLLKVGDLNISGVGQQVGFTSVSSFIRQFKNSTGKAPSEYRKSAAVAAESSVGRH